MFKHVHVCVDLHLEHLLELQTGIAANKPREEIFWILSPLEIASLKSDMQTKTALLYY